MFPLKHLFGFCEYTKILYLIKITLSMVRKDDATISASIFYGAGAVEGAGARPATSGKIKFDSLEWHIPSISPSLEIEEIISKRLSTKKPINMIFMRRNINQITIPTGSTHTWNLGNFNNSPRFIFVSFKSNDAPSPQANNALTTCYSGTDKITSLRVQLNSMYYPIDRMQFNFLDNDILEPYISYANCCNTFGVEAQLSAQEFKDLYPIFCFDVSAQSRTLKDNGITVSLHIEKSSALSLQGYCVVLEDCSYTIDVEKGSMVRVN
jgi:hypothetical protein